ncbi:MAG: nucleotidyltransferase domain-containing protein [Methanomassiliicoccaceae archaeon]|nr:nucleotidyltransferase domain-containing protein [Methanomassiliicoccaceae archaeon]
MTSSAQKFHTIDELKLLVAPVAKKYGVGKVFLFGSVARGDHEDDSDYDFCIELGEIRGIELGGFYMDLMEAVGKETDLVDTESCKPDFLSRIMNESVLLYGE